MVESNVSERVSERAIRALRFGFSAYMHIQKHRVLRTFLHDGLHIGCGIARRFVFHDVFLFVKEWMIVVWRSSLEVMTTIGHHLVLGSVVCLSIVVARGECGYSFLFFSSSSYQQFDCEVKHRSLFRSYRERQDTDYSFLLAVCESATIAKTSQLT